MVTAVVGAFFRIEIVPALVVHRNLSGLWIAVIQAVVLLRCLEIVGVVNIRVVVKTTPIGGLTLASRLCGLSAYRERSRQQQQNQNRTSHRLSSLN